MSDSFSSLLLVGSSILVKITGCGPDELLYRQSFRHRSYFLIFFLKIQVQFSWVLGLTSPKVTMFYHVKCSHTSFGCYLTLCVTYKLSITQELLLFYYRTGITVSASSTILKFQNVFPFLKFVYRTTRKIWHGDPLVSYLLPFEGKYTLYHFLIISYSDKSVKLFIYLDP